MAPHDELGRFTKQGCSAFVQIGIPEVLIYNCHIPGESIQECTLLDVALTQGIHRLFFSRDIAETPDPGNSGCTVQRNTSAVQYPSVLEHHAVLKRHVHRQDSSNALHLHVRVNKQLPGRDDHVRSTDGLSISRWHVPDFEEPVVGKQQTPIGITRIVGKHAVRSGIESSPQILGTVRQLLPTPFLICDVASDHYNLVQSAGHRSKRVIRRLQQSAGKSG